MKKLIVIITVILGVSLWANDRYYFNSNLDRIWVLNDSDSTFIYLDFTLHYDMNNFAPIVGSWIKSNDTIFLAEDRETFYYDPIIRLLGSFYVPDIPDELYVNPSGELCWINDTCGYFVGTTNFIEAPIEEIQPVTHASWKYSIPNWKDKIKDVKDQWAMDKSVKRVKYEFDPKCLIPSNPE